MLVPVNVLIFLFELLPYALDVGNYNSDIPVVVVVVVTFCVGRVVCVTGILGVVVFSYKFCSSWLSAQGGNWHAWSVLLM